MEISVSNTFGTGDIDAHEISPAVLEIAVDPERSAVAEDVFLRHSGSGNFRYTGEPSLGRFQISIGQCSDFNSIEEALGEVVTLEDSETPCCSRDAYAIRALIRELQQQREEAIRRKETDIIEDDIATGIYGDDF